jgi:hypothetical protein
MRGVSDATRDLQVFWDDQVSQIVFGIYLIWFFGLNVKNLPNWEATIFLADCRIRTTHRLCILANAGYAECNSYTGTKRRLTSRLSALRAHVS